MPPVLVKQDELSKDRGDDRDHDERIVPNAALEIVDLLARVGAGHFVAD
jgi:hypothetical protein